jgi:predicted DNA-binding transcriptional regulator AlpA
MHNRRQAKRAGKHRLGESALVGAEVESVGLHHARTRRRARHDGDPAADAAAAPELVIAARLSKRLGISTVTLWRWRHDPQLGFPTGIRINDRVYFPWREVTAWLQRQQQTA